MPYLWGMELIEFLKKHHTYLNLQKIEKKCNIPLTTLKGVVYKGRGLKSEYADRIIDLLDFVPLSHSVVDKRKKQSIPDLNPDGSFNDKWKKYFNFFEHESGLCYKYEVVNGLFKPTVRC